MNLFIALCQNKQGKVVIAQPPNIPILIWIVLVFAGMITQGDIATSFQTLSRMVLFAWAYLEVSHGDSTFRRLLGGVVALYLVVSTFV